MVALSVRSMIKRVNMSAGTFCFFVPLFTPAFSGGHKWVELLRNLCILGGPQKRGTKSEVATSPLLYEGATSGRNCNVTPNFSGVPRIGDRIRSGHFTPTFSGAHKWAELLRNPAFSGSQEKGTKKSEVYRTPTFAK